MSDDTAASGPEWAPNDDQQELIDTLDGTVLVDAGPGTGKTFAVTRRYVNLLRSKPIEPEDVCLITFTRNAAAEMRERILDRTEASATTIGDAPIQTFHSLCQDILRESGFDAPGLLGIDDQITADTRVVSNEIVEETLFEECYEQFRDTHPEHAAICRTIDDPGEIQGLIGELAAKGVFPTADGWYRGGEAALEGDREAFVERFAALNEPRNGGSKQSRLREALTTFGDTGLHLPDAPTKETVRGEGKQLPGEIAERVFDADREALQSFVHDIYVEYLRFALSRDYLTFGFLQLFAFVLICEDETVREQVGFEYVMIDEFQDSSEIQFKLALLLARTENICVVGDWKQSIYGFQYADVENILEFEHRLDRFAADLNADRRRIEYDTSIDERIELSTNYRSTASIIEFATAALTTPASGSEEVDTEAISERLGDLESAIPGVESRIEAIENDDEPAAILTAIGEMVDNEAYAVPDEDGGTRPPTYADIGVLTRTRDFGRSLQAAADEHGLPMAYEGGLEIFRTDQAKLLLAWLRILEADADRGWAVVLERAGYDLGACEAILESASYPDAMVAFRERLRAMETLPGVMRTVFDRYGCTGPRAAVLIDTIESIRTSTTLTRGGLIGVIARGIEHGTTQEIQAGAGTDAVTVRTIHAVKGLEHPIVILANMNSGRFPSSGGSSGNISYEEGAGLRQRDVYAEADGQPYIYRDWKTEIARKCRPTEYDEERRLLYVALSRAQRHILCTAGESPNTFLEELPVSLEPGVVDIPPFETDADERPVFEMSMPEPRGPQSSTPHELGATAEEAAGPAESAGGMSFGDQVHGFAEAYALGNPVAPANDHEEAVASFLDGLPGELRPEEHVHLPLEAEGQQVTLSGIIDLLQITDEAVAIVDYKTDADRSREESYRRQLSAYYHAIAELFPERSIDVSLFWTRTGERADIEPLEREEVADGAVESSN